MIIPRHNLAENRETGMGNRWAVVPPCTHHVSLPGIGEYRVPTIFDNKKSKNIIKNTQFEKMFFFINFPRISRTILLAGKRLEVDSRQFFHQINFLKIYFFVFLATNSWNPIENWWFARMLSQNRIFYYRISYYNEFVVQNAKK